MIGAQRRGCRGAAEAFMSLPTQQLPGHAADADMPDVTPPEASRGQAAAGAGSSAAAGAAEVLAQAEEAEAATAARPSRPMVMARRRRRPAG